MRRAFPEKGRARRRFIDLSALFSPHSENDFAESSVPNGKERYKRRIRIIL